MKRVSNHLFHIVVFVLFVLLVPVSTQATSVLPSVVYTSFSGKGSLENGTKDNPYSDFGDAVANVADGGTIYVLGGDTSEYGFIDVASESDQDAPFVIDKEVTVESESGMTMATLSCRAAGILLEADVTFKNIQMDFANSYHDHIYANGYHLTLDNVTRYQGAKVIDLVAGGLYDATAGIAVSETSGTHATITVVGRNSHFGNIYAGGMNGGYTGDVTIELQDISSSSVNEIYACGATEPYVDRDDMFNFDEPAYPEANSTAYPVTGTVNVAIKDASPLYVYGAGATGGTQVSYTATYLRMGQTLDSISKLTVVEGTVQPKMLTAPAGENVNLEIQANGKLDLSGLGAVTAGDFTGCEGSTLILAKEGSLTINGVASGGANFETVGGVDGCSGEVITENDHVYITAPITSCVTFSYTPAYEQKGYTFVSSSREDLRQWKAAVGKNIRIVYYAVGYTVGDEEIVAGAVNADYEVLLPDETAEGATAIPKEGYHFVKWINYETGELVSTEPTLVPNWDEDYLEEYYYDAYFEPNAYSVSFDANGGNGTMNKQTFTYGVEQALVQNEYTRDGYDFAGWNTSSDGTGSAYTDQQIVSSLTTKQDGSIMLYAQWTVKSGSGNASGEEAEDGTNDSGNKTENEVNDSNDETENGSGSIQDFQPNTEFDIRKLTGVKVSKVTYNTVKLVWCARSDATGYQIYRSTKKKSGYKKVATVTTTTYTDKKLKTGKKYYYKVRAISDDEKTAFSDVIVGGPKLAKPVVKVSKGKKCATIKYSKVKGAHGYEIYRSTKKNKGFKKIKTTTKKRYKNSKLKSKKTYYYKVRAYRKVDGKKVYSSYSKVKAVKIK